MVNNATYPGWLWGFHYCKVLCPRFLVPRYLLLSVDRSETDQVEIMKDGSLATRNFLREL